MKVWVSVTLAVWRASPVTCQSVTVRDGCPPPRSTCQRGGMTGDKAGVTDSDRAVIPSARRGQEGCLSTCHHEWQSGVLCPRWSDAASRKQTGPGCGLHLFHKPLQEQMHMTRMHTHINAGHINTRASANRSVTLRYVLLACSPAVSKKRENHFVKPNTLILLPLLKAAEHMMKL